MKKEYMMVPVENCMYTTGTNEVIILQKDVVYNAVMNNEGEYLITLPVVCGSNFEMRQIQVDDIVLSKFNITRVVNVDEEIENFKKSSETLMDGLRAYSIREATEEIPLSGTMLKNEVLNVIDSLVLILENLDLLDEVTVNKIKAKFEIGNDINEMRFGDRGFSLYDIFRDRGIDLDDWFKGHK